MRLGEAVLRAVRGAVVAGVVVSCSAAGDRAPGIAPVSEPAATLVPMEPVLPEPPPPILAAFTPPPAPNLVVEDLRDEAAGRRKRNERRYGSIGSSVMTITTVGCGRG